MCALSLHYFLNNLTVPTQTNIPPQGSELYRNILSRQIQSLNASLVTEIFAWQTLGDSPGIIRDSIGLKTKMQVGQLKARLDSNKPTTLILIRSEGISGDISKNHQVVACGYEYNTEMNQAVIFVYDPNLPLTTQRLSINTNPETELLQGLDSSGNLLRGFFIHPFGDKAAYYPLK